MFSIWQCLFGSFSVFLDLKSIVRFHQCTEQLNVPNSKWMSYWPKPTFEKIENEWKKSTNTGLYAPHFHRLNSVMGVICQHLKVGCLKTVDDSFLKKCPSCFVGSPYYDNVRPLSYPDADAVLICFDISRPETLDSVLRKVGTVWHDGCNRVHLWVWLCAVNSSCLCSAKARQ